MTGRRARRLSLAMAHEFDGRVPLATIAHAAAAFPTRDELWLKCLESYEKQEGVAVHAR